MSIFTLVKRSFVITTLVVLFVSSALSQNAEQYLIDMTSGAFSPKRMAAIYSMNDGERYTMLSADRTQIIAYNIKTGAQESVVFDVKTAKGCTLTEISGYEFDANETRILINTARTPIYRRSFTTTYYVYDVRTKEFAPLSNDHAPQQMARFAPNGRMVAFSYNNNLYIKKLDFNTEIQITKDGLKNHIINGTPDWVYEEEFGRNRYFEWSPDSRLLAWVRFDESAIEQFSFDQYEHPYDKSYTYKYPKAGTTNSYVQVLVYNIETKATLKMNCGEGNDLYFPIIKFSNTPERLAVVRLNRNQTRLELLSVNPKSGVATTLLNETDKVYIDYQNFNSLHFNSDGSFICLSERDGYRHAYLFNEQGMLMRQITKGDWDITGFYGYDEKSRTAYFQAAKEHPSQRHIYKVDAKQNITNLDPRPGTHSALFTNGYKYMISEFHNSRTANSTTLCDNKGKAIRTIIENSDIQAKVDAYKLPEKEFITLTTNDNITLHGWIVRPVDFDQSRQYPLVMVQYSGPDSQEALDRFRPDWEYYLSMNGYVVACVDSRGTGAKGHDFRTCTYWHLGTLETRDQIAAARKFGEYDYIDASRMAIWGWSFGGFMTLNCLTSDDNPFKAGIAVAPVTDWRLYNTAYTERFMSTPQQNYAGYEESNLIDRASNLTGKLLLCHGTADDNVHIQHSMLFVKELVENGIQFEMQFYPDKNHSILGAKTRLHLYTRFNEFLKNNL